MSTIILVCDHAYPSGGLAKVAIAEAAGLAARGHRVVFLAAVGPVCEALRQPGITVACLDQSDLLGADSRVEVAVRATWNTEAARRLSAIIRGCPPHDTIVHLHGWAKALSPSVVRACRRSGLPALFTLHDYFALCPNGAFYDYRRGENCTRRALSPSCIATRCDARAHAHKLWRLTRHAIATAADALTGGLALIYLSERQRQVLEPHLPADTRLFHVPNPVEVADDGPAPVEENETFLFLGRLSREKGAILLAEAAAALGVPARFVGAGSEAAAIRRILPGAELSGWLPEAAVAQAIRGARALVFPSLWYETFGLAVYEALAKGVPAIVSDNTAAVEAIVPGETGLLFRSGDAGDLAARMRVLGDAATAKRFGRRAHQVYWRDPLTLERHLDRLEEVYGQVRRPVRAAAGDPGLPQLRTGLHGS